jgi:hypothetical protein
MKRVFKYTGIVALIVLTASVVVLGTFAIVNFSKGNTVIAYHRLYKQTETGNTFNYWGLLSPVQVESQERTVDTMHFIRKVIYPLAPKFDLVEPTDTAEIFVANEIANAVIDSVNKVEVTPFIDYDGQSQAVRSVQGLKTPTVAKPTVKVILFGTASPESEKDGFWQSIEPENYEPENAELAAKRLHRTEELLLDKLHVHGINVVDSVSSREIQFSELDSYHDTATIHQQLDSMRFVSAKVYIPTEHIRITTATAPISIPIAVALASLVLYLLWGTRRTVEPIRSVSSARALSLVEPIHAEDHPIDWMKILFGLLRIIKTLVVIALVSALIYRFWRCILWILLACFVLFLLISLMSYIKDWYVQKKTYWSTKPLTCKLVVLNLLLFYVLLIAALVTYLLGYWHICS